MIKVEAPERLSRLCNACMDPATLQVAVIMEGTSGNSSTSVALCVHCATVLAEKVYEFLETP